jgi:hypothetical protein
MVGPFHPPSKTRYYHSLLECIHPNGWNPFIHLQRLTILTHFLNVFTQMVFTPFIHLQRLAIVTHYLNVFTQRVGPFHPSSKTSYYHSHYLNLCTQMGRLLTCKFWEHFVWPFPIIGELFLLLVRFTHAWNSHPCWKISSMLDWTTSSLFITTKYLKKFKSVDYCAQFFGTIWVTFFFPIMIGKLLCLGFIFFLNSHPSMLEDSHPWWTLSSILDG